MTESKPLLLKLSGEALKGDAAGIFDRSEIDRVCQEIIPAVQAGRQLAIVVGGGNIMRGATVAGQMSDPAIGDYMGMLATQINALALKDGLLRAGANAEVVGPHAIPNVCHLYNRAQVMRWLAASTIVIFGGGTGHPFLTTDTAAAMRGAEIEAAAVLKGSNVDGVYDSDPRQNPAAKRFETLSFDAAIAGCYGVMDQTAFAICRDRGVAIRVFNMTEPGAIAAALSDNPPGTLVGA